MSDEQEPIDQPEEPKVDRKKVKRNYFGKPNKIKVKTSDKRLSQNPVKFFESLGVTSSEADMLRDRLLFNPKHDNTVQDQVWTEHNFRRAQGRTAEKRPAFAYPFYDKNDSYKFKKILENSPDLKALMHQSGLERVISHSIETAGNMYNQHDIPINFMNKTEEIEKDLGESSIVWNGLGLIADPEQREIHRRFLVKFCKKYHKTQFDKLKACYEIGMTSHECSDETGIPQPEVKAFWKGFATRLGWKRSRLRELLEKKLMLRNLIKHVAEIESSSKLSPTEWSIVEDMYHKRVVLLDTTLDLMGAIIKRGKEMSEEGIQTAAQLKDFSIVAKNLAEAVLRKEAAFDVQVNTDSGSVESIVPQINISFDIKDRDKKEAQSFKLAKEKSGVAAKRVLNYNEKVAARMKRYRERLKNKQEEAPMKETEDVLKLHSGVFTYDAGTDVDEEDGYNFDDINSEDFEGEDDDE